MTATPFTLTNKPNRYAANCNACGVRVPEGEGWINKVDGRWLTVHATACPTPEVPVIEAPTGSHSWSYSPQAEAASLVIGYSPRHRAIMASEVGVDLPWTQDEADEDKAPTPSEQAGVGFYVRGSEVFRVVENKAKTATYAKRLRVYGSKLTWEYAPGVGRDLAAEGLTPMTGEQAGALGLAHGKCINCSLPLGGATLGAEVSALIGYGETCAKTNGWFYPKGAAAQRVYLIEHRTH